MLKPTHNPLLYQLLHRYILHRLRNGFGAIYALRLHYLRELGGDRPVLAFGNHPGWWDLFLIHRLRLEAPRLRHYGMMEEAQLAPNRLLTALGVFGVDLSARGKGAAGLRYAVDRLREPGSAVWVFPEGELRTPFDAFEPQRGFGFLVKAMDSGWVLPFALRYEFFRDDLPVALAAFGEPRLSTTTDVGELTAAQQALQGELQEVARRRCVQGMEVLQRPRLSVNKRWEWCQRAVTGRLRDFDPHN